MRIFVRTLLLSSVFLLVLSVAGVAAAAPRLSPGEGWPDGPHNSYPGLCTNCHTFSVWPPPAITEGEAPTHRDRGSNCTGCHTFNAAPVAPIAAPAAFASAVSGSEITVAWTAVSGASSYRVYRSTSAGGTYTEIASTSARVFKDARRSAGVRYYYKVKGAIAAGQRGPASTVVSASTFKSSRVTVDSSLTQFSATGWSTRTGSKYLGGSTRSSSTPGRTIVVPFRGTQVTWYGTRGKKFGKAKVYIDGRYVKTVDLYSRKTQYKRAVFTKTGLGDSAHTIKIVVQKKKNRRSAGRRVDVDAFGFVGTAPGLNQEESRGSARGAWSTLRSAYYSAGTAKASSESTASISYRFYGTGVTWLASKNPSAGKAAVYVDGAWKATVDLWAGTSVTRRPVYVSGGLVKRTHTLKIVPVAACNPVAAGSTVNVDAFVTR